MSQSSAQYYAFIEEILQHQKVWALRDEQGFPTSTNLSGETTMPFWSLQSRAEKIIKNVPGYKEFQLHAFTLDEFLSRWLTGLEKDGLFVGVNWSGKNATGFNLKPEEVIERIKHERGIE